MSEQKAIEIVVDIGQKIDKKTGVKNCCGHFWGCTSRVLAIMLYVLSLVVPLVSEIWPLIHYRENADAIKITLLVHTCLLMIMWFITGIKMWPSYEYWYSHCGNPSSFKNFFTIGHLLGIVSPWGVIHVIAILVTSLLHPTPFWISATAIVVIAFVFLLGLGIGYSITLEQTKDYCKPFNCNCFRSFTSITLYMLFIITPILSESWPLIYYNDYVVSKITILIHTIALMVLALVVGIKLWLDCTGPVNPFIGKPSEFKSLITTGFLLYVMLPWFFVNLICIAVWGSRLVSNGDVYVIILGVPGIVLTFVMALSIGYAIMKEFKKNNYYDTKIPGEVAKK